MTESGCQGNYKHFIHPDFSRLPPAIPFKPFIVSAGALSCRLMGGLLPTPGGVVKRRFYVRGYRDLKVPVEVFEPENAEQKLPCLLYIHGGGFGYPAAPYHRRLACVYAKKANCRVLLPDYHLLPRHRFPAAYKDVLNVYSCICSRSNILGIDKRRIAVAGDSAGAALAANLCNTVTKHGLPAPCLQMLLYPVTDVSMKTPSMYRYTAGPGWNAPNTRMMWNMYLADAGLEEVRQASPMHNPLPDKLPYTYIETAEFDCLHDEGVQYAERLREAGVKVELYETAGTIHGYDFVKNSTVTHSSVMRRLEVLRRTFEQERLNAVQCD